MIASIKRRLHREICANPVLHGLVLNLYLNGEQYPHRVDDYFPVEAAPDEALAARMRHHLMDEDKHALMYRRAIGKLGQPVLRLASQNIYNHVIRSHFGMSFAVRPDDPRDARRLKLAHFFAHLYWLEKRVATSLAVHAEACALSPVGYVYKVVSCVLADEQRHVAYTRDAVYDLVPRGLAQEVLARHARAERAANFEFSSQQLEKLTTQHARLFSPFSKWLYRLSAHTLAGAQRYV